LTLQEEVQDRIYGIDLGTTYSCLAYVDESSGVPVIVANSEGNLITPSVVFFSSESQVEVGQSAKNSFPVDPDKGVAFVKRDMGTEKISTILGKDYRPEDISAFILRKLVQDASVRLKEQGKLNAPIKRVVITVPAYFGQTERKATKDAGIIAGLEVVDILNEPTAAALSYRAGQPPTDDILLVFDLGGGTFDITLMQVSGTSIREIFVEGLHRRGGYDWDVALLNLLVDRFLQKHPELEEARTNESWRRAMLETTERMKKDLSRSGVESTKAMVIYGTVAAQVEITREEFENETKELLDGTMSLVDSVLKKIDDESLKPRKVYLVGGSTKMPAVPLALDALLSKRLLQKVEIIPRDPDLAVAKGAAFHGFILRLKEIIEKNAGDFRAVTALFPFAEPYIRTTPVFTVLSRALGFQVIRDGKHIVSHLAFRNNPLPIHASATYGTLTDKQDSVCLPVFEQAGDELSEDPAHNKRIGELEITGLRPFSLPESSPIEASLHVEADGTVNVSAREPVSNKKVSARLVIIGAMTAKDVSDRTKENNSVAVSFD
jgi:molecular chaperone DnaK